MSAQVAIQSFSYRAGLPERADYVFDVRFLKNPHYVAALEPLTGRDAGVGEHIRQDEAFAPFMDALVRLMLSVLPRYAERGPLNIAIGCTGGKHRSVFVAEELAKALAGHGHAITLSHREQEYA